MTKGKKILLGIVIAFAVIYAGLVIWAYLPMETVPAKELAGSSDKFINIKGLEVRYVSQGEGESIVLVHGMGCSVYSWRKLIPLLSDEYKVYAFDLPGFGLTDKPADYNYALESQGNFVIDFLDAVGIDKAIIVGHSMGGVIAGYAAANYPERVSKLVLNNAGYYSGGAPEFLKYLFFPLDRISSRQFFNREFERAMLKIMYYDDSLATDETVDAYLLAGKTSGAVDALAAMTRGEGPMKYVGVSERITVPTLIIWGKNDANIHFEDSQRLHNEIKGSEIIYIEKCGHMVPEEKPEEMASAIKDFLKKNIISE